MLGIQSQIRLQILRSKPVDSDHDIQTPTPKLSDLYEWCKWRIQLVIVLLFNRYREEGLQARLRRYIRTVADVARTTSAFKFVYPVLSRFVDTRAPEGYNDSAPADLSTCSQIDGAASTSDHPGSPEMQPSVSVCTTASSSFPPSSNCQFKFNIPQMEPKRLDGQYPSNLRNRSGSTNLPENGLSPLVSTSTPDSSTSTVEASGKTDKDVVYDILRTATSRNQPKTLAIIASDSSKKSASQFTTEEIRSAAAAVDPSGYSLLHLAVNTGSEATLKQVLDIIGTGQEQQAAVRSSGATKAQFTPLHLAAMKGSLKMVERLLSAGADSRATTRLGCTALHIAAARGHDDICKVLVTNGADVNAISETKSTPLASAVHAGHVKVIESLLDHGADPHLRPQGGQTALEIARSRGYSDLATVIESRS